MKSSYLARTTYAHALECQRDAIARAQPTIFGFEPDPVVTLGLRASSADLIAPLHDFAILPVDRGGQATIHNPGQLVIFPAARIVGVKAWIKLLADVTVACLAHWQITSRWDDYKPGLFTERGKIMACGLRVRNSWNTHGIAINVANDLTPFAKIRACGLESAAVDRIGEGVLPAEVFARWFELFNEMAEAKGIDNYPQIEELLST